MPSVYTDTLVYPRRLSCSVTESALDEPLRRSVLVNDLVTEVEAAVARTLDPDLLSQATHEAQRVDPGHLAGKQQLRLTGGGDACA